MSGDQHAAGVKGRRRAQDRADILRVADLIERDYDASPGSGLDLTHNAVEIGFG